MFNKITLLLKHGLQLDASVLSEIRSLAKGSKVKIIAFNDLKKEDLSDADLIITFGGDGTFVKAANLIEDSFILGVNANPDSSEGWLIDLDISEVNKLKDLFAGQHKTLVRQRASVRLNGKLLPEQATNEVYIGAASQFHSSRYKITYKSKEEEHRSSGVLVTTGTGSTAWFAAAGGKPFACHEEKLAFLVREPYVGKRIFLPKIMKGELKKGEVLTIRSTRDFGGILAINDSTYDFNTGDVVEIELSDKPLKVLQLK
jgi:NAD kinase